MKECTPKFLPGFEPDDIKPLVDSFFTVINKAFPDKVVVTSEWNHQAWDNAANMLCKKLGYSKGKEFLEAYGFSVVSERQIAESSLKKQNSIQNVPFTENSELYNRNLDGAKQAKNKKLRSRFSTVLLITIIILMVAVAIISIIAIRKVAQRVTFSPDNANSLFTQSNSGYSDGSESKSGKSRTVDDINADISIASMDKSADNFESLEKLYLEYIELPDSEQRKIVGNTLINAFSQSVVKKVCEYKNNETDDARKILATYKQILSDEQIIECLVSIGSWEGLEKAEEYIKGQLKNPHSYKRYSGSVRTPSAGSADRIYTCSYEIEYGATNSFGGMVEGDMTVVVDFNIDIETLEIDYTYAGSGKLDVFEIEKRYGGRK